MWKGADVFFMQFLLLKLKVKKVILQSWQIKNKAERDGERKRMTRTTGRDLHSNPQWCHGQLGMLRAQTGLWSRSWVNWEHVWESLRLAWSRGNPEKADTSRSFRADRNRESEWERMEGELLLAEWKPHVKINRYPSVNVCEFAFCVRSLFVPAWPVYRVAAHCCCAWRALVHVLETTVGSDRGEGREGPPPPTSPLTPPFTNSPAEAPRLQPSIFIFPQFPL